jgi:hypothetical protein
MRYATCLGLGITLAAITLGCSGSGKIAQSSTDEQSLAEALTKNVVFLDGLVKNGAIGKPDPAARKVKLAGVAGLDLKPDVDESLMPLTVDVDNPDEGSNALDVVLMQFEGSKSHIEVASKLALAHGHGPVGHSDAGADADAGAVQGEHSRLDLYFDVDEAKTCATLCNKQYRTQLVVAVALADGSISEHQLRAVALDCTKNGDPKRCGKTGSARKDAGAADTASHDAAASGDAGTPIRNDASSSGDRDGGSSRADAASVGSGNAPQIGPLTPANATAGMSLTLSIGGSAFIDGAVAYVDDTAVDTTFTSDTALEAMIPAASTQNAGSLAIYVENVPGDASSRSNVLYLQVDPAAGAPVIYDYSPDNGVAGDTILIIASNLAGQTLHIKDSSGNSLKPGTLGTISWPNAGSADTVEVVLPKGIETGPISVANDVGSFQGKIFTVGQNLTRLSGTTFDSSTQYNDSNWARASGGDNQLATSFFTAHGDCASMTSCTTKPWYEIIFAADQIVARIAIRGNREYASGYDFLRGKFDVLDASDGVLWTGTYDLPAPDRDLDLTLPVAVPKARKVKFSGLQDESDEPGFSELEVFAK